MLRRLLFLSTMTLPRSESFSNFPLHLTNMTWIASAYVNRDVERLFLDSYKEIGDWPANNSTQEHPYDPAPTMCLWFKLKQMRKQHICNIDGYTYVVPNYRLQRIHQDGTAKLHSNLTVPLMRYKSYDFDKALQTIRCIDEDGNDDTPASRIVLLRKIDESYDHFLLVVMTVPPWYVKKVGSVEMLGPEPKLHPYIVTNKIYSQEKLQALVKNINDRKYHNMPRIDLKCFRGNF